MPVPTPALLTLQHHVVLTLHFIWVPKAVALLTEQTASENTALLTSRHQSKVIKYGRYPNTAIRRRFLSALFRSRPRYRRNKTCVHGRSIAPSVSTSCLVRKARRETGRSSIASYGHFSAHARATNAIKLAFMAGLAPSGRALLGKRLEWHQFSSKLVYIAINQKGAERPCLLAVKHLQCVSGHTANA